MKKSSDKRRTHDGTGICHLQVEVLARAHALLAETGTMGWSHLEMSAVKPFHPRTFWKHANTLYRHFTVFFLAHALHVSLHPS